MKATLLAFLASLTMVGCGGHGASGTGANHQGTDLGAVPDRATRGLLSGDLCKDQECTCRDDSATGDGGAGVASEGHKRFEIRVGPGSNELWVGVGSNMYYKSAERSTACFYVDLEPGQTPVTIRASHSGGISAAVAISEYGTDTKSWYQTFGFTCGSPGVCSYQELDDNKVRYQQVVKGLHDPCGSVRVEKLNWNSSEAADQVHPNELAVTLNLNIYKFAPRKAHGETCSTGG
jgi:hypothetical protein